MTLLFKPGSTPGARGFSGLRSGFVALLFVAVAAGVEGCASPGIPRPPSLHLPATVTDLAATRIGNRVELRWTGPARTTDGLDLVDPKVVPTVVEICRDPRGTAPRSGGPGAIPRCTPVLRTAGHPGASTAVDMLPANLTGEATRGAAVAYRVRVLNESGRSAAPSARVLIPGGPPVEEIASFRATQARNGVVLTWKPGGDGTIEVSRTLVSPLPASRAASNETDMSGGHGRGAGASPVVSLRADLSVPDKPDAEGRFGMLDADALPDANYFYRAERVRSVTLAGGAVVVVRSEPTPALQVAMRDTFPPQPPTGLAGVPGVLRSGPGILPVPTIDLSWQPNTETDLAGYYVYRTDLGPGSPDTRSLRMTASLLSSPAYRDASVTTGERYAYRITAVDQRGNESRSGGALTETAAKPF